MFVKVFEQILDSSIAEDWMVRHVFEDFLKLADKHGVVDMTASAVSRRTGVPLDVVSTAIAKLTEPDRESRSPDEDGRRLILIDHHRSWGWRIVNYTRYRNIRDEDGRREYFREQKRRQRASKGVGQDEDKQGLSKNVQDSPAVSTQAEAEAEAKAEAKKQKPAPKASPSMFTLPCWIPQDAWGAFEEMRKKIRAPLTDRARQGTVRDLERLAKLGNDVEAVLMQSVTRAYRGVFEIKQDSQSSTSRGTNGANKPSPTRERVDRGVGAVAKFLEQRGVIGTRVADGPNDPALP